MSKCDCPAIMKCLIHDVEEFNVKEVKATLVRLAIAVHRFKEDNQNPKRLKTLENLYEKLEEYIGRIDEKADDLNKNLP